MGKNLPLFLIICSGYSSGMETPSSTSSLKAKRGSTLVDPRVESSDSEVELPKAKMNAPQWSESAQGTRASSESESDTPPKKKSPKVDRKKSKEEIEEPKSPRSIKRLQSLIGMLPRSTSTESSSSAEKIKQAYNAINRKNTTSQRNHVAELLIALNGLEPSFAQQYLLMQMRDNPDYQNLDDVTLQLCGAVARKEKGGANELLKIMLPLEYQKFLLSPEGKKSEDDTRRSRSESGGSHSSVGKSISGALRGRKGALVGLLTTLFIGLATNLTTYFVGSNPAALSQCTNQLSTCQAALNACTQAIGSTSA